MRRIERSGLFLLCCLLIYLLEADIAFSYFEHKVHGTAITGKFVDDSGTPVAGVLVVDSFKTNNRILAESDGNGIFSVFIENKGDRRQRRSFWLLARKCGFMNYRKKVFINSELKIHVGNVVLCETGSVSGVVYDKDGNGVSDALVVCTGPSPIPDEEGYVRESGLVNWRNNYGFTVANSRGEYKIENIPEKQIRVWSGGGGYFYSSRSGITINHGRETRDVDIGLEKIDNEMFVSGAVTCLDGRESIDPVVWVVDRSSRDIEYRKVMVNLIGEFQLVSKEIDELSCFADTEDEKYRSSVVRCRAGNSNFNIVLKKRKTIRVCVKEKGKGSIPYFQVRINKKYDEKNMFLVRTYYGGRGEGGVAEIAVPDGFYFITVWANGYLSRRIGPFDPLDVNDIVYIELIRHELKG